MKRLLNILFVLTATIAVSCSRYSVTNLGPGKSYIFFEPDMLKIAETKVDLISEFPTAEGTAFGVLGFYNDGNPIFTGYKNNIANIYKNSDVYKYDNLSPWVGDQKHTFHAFYPYTDLVNSIAVGSDNIPYISYTQPTTVADMKDILGVYTEVESPVSAVQLHFQHLLWAFNIVVKNSQTKETAATGDIVNPYMKVTEVTFKLQEFPSSVNLKLDESYTVTSNNTQDQSYTIYSNGTGEQINHGESKVYGPLLFIPITGLKYQVTVKYTTQGGASGTYVYPAAEEYKTVSSGFEHGKAYDLTIEKKNDKFFVGNINANGAWVDADEDIFHTFQ